MIDSIALYVRYLRQSVLSQLEYRTSFILSSISVFLISAIEFLGIWALFSRFGSLEGWTLAEVALFYGTLNMVFAFADAIGRGFDTFDVQVKSGAFDRLLLRPRSTVLQLFGFELTLRRIGRFSQGLVVFVYAVIYLGIYRSPFDLLLILHASLGTALLFIGLLIVQATISFWTVESLEVMNTMTYGGVQSAQYPMSIYRRFFRRIFIFVVPLFLSSYMPLATALGRGDWPLWLAWVAPLSGAIYFAVSLQLWKVGVHHYTSTGS